MSTLQTTNLKNPSSGSNNIVLNADGTSTLTQLAGGAITKGTAIATTSGTNVNFTGIPSWVKRVTVMFSGMSLSGTSNFLIQLGGSGGVETTGYISAFNTVYASPTYSGASAQSTNGFILFSAAPNNVLSGVVVFNNIDGNLWLGNGQWGYTNTNQFTAWVSGEKTLSSTLDRIRITTTNGTDTFDAGTVNIMYEG